MSGGDRQMGLFHGRTMAGAEAGMGAEGGGFGSIYGLESTQRVYNSLDMQVIGDYKNLVDGCNSNHTTLSTSDIAPLDDSTLKVGRLSPEERKEKIHRYLKKRSERNFNKKIKVAVIKEEDDILNSSDIFSQINGVNSFNYNYTIESWI
ncbi:uncharacterized protein A4U43_C04F1830 [Asparagus officinalis]|uniref:CCT domain-containing protein n=1 Tax=Asparagus officinalis TaxID=4686 RepID=A0A5P1EXM0_ASPOF|nr:uncharacterized protein A4U43_C04F1830 [Asparagus officinalis]